MPRRFLVTVCLFISSPSPSIVFVVLRKGPQWDSQFTALLVSWRPTCSTCELILEGLILYIFCIKPWPTEHLSVTDTLSQSSHTLLAGKEHVDLNGASTTFTPTLAAWIWANQIIMLNSSGLFCKTNVLNVYRKKMRSYILKLVTGYTGNKIVYMFTLLLSTSSQDPTHHLIAIIPG